MLKDLSIDTPEYLINLIEEMKKKFKVLLTEVDEHIENTPSKQSAIKSNLPPPKSIIG